MPKPTFFKLTEEKQQILIDAAMREFAGSTFDEVKISTIIKSAKIPRSSFYDYFDDKEDVYLYLLSIIKEKKQTHMAPFLQAESSSFFESLRELLKAGALFAAQYPLYEQMAKKLYENKQFMQKVAGEDQQNVTSIYKELVINGMESGELNPTLDAQFIAECIYQLTISFVDGFKDNGDEKISDTINEKTEKLISLLKNGIGNY